MKKIIMALFVSAAILSSGCIASGVGYLQDRNEAKFAMKTMGNGVMLSFDVGDYFAAKPKKAWGLALLDLAIDGTLYAVLKENTDWFDGGDKSDPTPKSEAAKESDINAEQRGNRNKLDLEYTYVPGKDNTLPKINLKQDGDDNEVKVEVKPLVEEEKK